ncbi:MAG: 1-acyl-sn-glycerol-3-phosphate acyltransferase [Anaerolineales bacterium]|nr:MAG: 1-acyl-sn-glycerol-3-phosphate acyltransferase [Anaerolineales bacterium]
MTLTQRVVNTTIKYFTRIICRIDDTALSLVPSEGPLLLVTNHINFLEVPIVYTHLQPRPVTGFAKAETWDNRMMALLFDLWKAIPIQRGEADIKALRRGLGALAEGQILAVAPEGTRSGDGRLGQGQPGIVMLALKSGAPLLPVVCYGGEVFWDTFRRFRRTDFHLIVGHPFTLKTPGVPLSREIRQRMIDEVMYQLAALLPIKYRGVYAHLERATEQFLEFQPGSSSNLPQAIDVIETPAT